MHDYTGFIASAYGISLVALVALALWIFLDARAQRRALKTLEARGVRRRSSSRPVDPASDAGRAKPADTGR